MVAADKNPRSSSEADLVFVNGKIWTVDPSNPLCEAVAVSKGRIVQVGSNEVVKDLIGSGTEVIELDGKLMLPGFIDNHTHFVQGAIQLSGINLRDADTPEELASRIGEWALEHPGTWITGGDWDHERWTGASLPTKNLIDPVTERTPVFLKRRDGHMALANSRALELAGITANMKDPLGGEIVRGDGTDEPIGILKESAMELVSRITPPPSEEEKLSAIKRAIKLANQYGVTSVQDISSSQDVQCFRRLEKEGELALRIFCRLPISEWKHLARHNRRVPFGTEMVRLGSVKAFTDGSLGSSTALFFDPYSDDSKNYGVETDVVLNGSLERWAFEADKAGLQLSLHAIGDKAVSRTLDLFERIKAANPPWDRRFRIEHAQHVHPKDFSRFKRLGVLVSAQPAHLIDDGCWAEKKIGPDRCKTSYPFRTFLDYETPLSFGSDWTVASLNPLVGICAAATRHTLDGENAGGWIPDQKISVEEAIAAYTIGGAYAAFEEKEKGSISRGKLADLVVLSKDILTADPSEIQKMTVEMTVLGGKIVHSNFS